MRKKNKKRKKILLIVFILLIIAVIGLYLYKFDDGTLKRKLLNKIKQNPQLQIYNQKSNKRPIAVMINNHNDARPYHSGLQKAQVVYEIIVEGGITRMMAVFKDQNIDRIGPVRSSRHYYLDYAMENDAIYVHWGWSPQAQSDIATYGINNLNGLYDKGFTRDESLIGIVNLEHTAITSTQGVMDAAKSKGYRMEYEDDVKESLPFKYSTKTIDLKPKEKEESDAIVANNITIPYSYYMTSSYKYDAKNKYYLRYANDEEHKDYITKEQYHFKNIIIIKMRNYTMDSYGRQDIDNVGSGKGYYITNGYARPITWEKTSRGAKTIYKYADGKEIVLNDGNTFVQIQPIDEETTITE